jgi:hypothetical protein
MSVNDNNGKHAGQSTQTKVGQKLRSPPRGWDAFTKHRNDCTKQENSANLVARTDSSGHNVRGR